LSGKGKKSINDKHIDGKVAREKHEFSLAVKTTKDDIIAKMPSW